MSEQNRAGCIGMGGVDGLDDRMKEIFDLMDYIPQGINSVLDIGFGRGQIPYRLKNEGKDVTSIGLAIESYGVVSGRIKPAVFGS